MKPKKTLVVILALAFLALGMPTFSQEKKKPVVIASEAGRFFESKIRPLLADTCFKCHGDKKHRGNLRLDSLAGMLTGGDQGPAILPGQPEKSLLLKVVRHEDAELKMPPSKKLTPRQIDDLARWVKMGAPWPGAEKTKPIVARPKEYQISDKDRAHWAFQPLKRPSIPAVKDRAWVKNPIDAFLLARLEAKGLKPNPPASRYELLRRLYYDLTGLPPTPQEVEAFLNDRSATAYEDLVDRLLNSPRYGEKWARCWLDLVRFAETNSYERDNPKPHAWRYRDYVIRAFNQDKPFDRFIREQLAGDELPDRDNDALIATGFYRLGIWDDEPVDREQARYDGLDDIITTTGQVFLGMTIDCARCHDHKIDPIPQKDYYRLLAFFHNINHYRNGGPTDEVALLPSPEARQQYEQAMRQREEKRRQVQAEILALEKEFRSLYEKNKGKLEAGDLEDVTFRFYRDSWTRLPDFNSLKPEETGKVKSQLFDLNLRRRNDTFGFVFKGFLRVPQDGKYTFFLDSDDGSRLTVAGKKVLEHDGIHGMGQEKKATVTLSKGRLPIKLEYFQNVFGLGLYVAWSGPDFGRSLLSASEGSKKARNFGQLLAEEGPRLLGEGRFARLRQLKKGLADLEKQTIPAQLALCVTEAGTRAPDTFVMLRGNPHVKGAKVQPGFLQVLGLPEPVIPEAPAGSKSSGRRLVLADWIASRDNPLTARVMANRIWQYHFGRGIVRSPNNFGTQGDRPTHPELLDWLAAEFIASDWRLKAMHRLILTSNAYCMSSKGHAEVLAADPTNDLFWRFDMRRLTAEEIRDSLLAISGTLNLKMYGPGVFPVIPREVLAGQSVPGRGWTPSSLEEQNRRSIYIHVKRSLLYPILECFDLAETDRSTPVRFSTTQPTQALHMLNGEFLNKQASLFADRLRREAKGTDQQVRLALYLTTCRPPQIGEVRRGLDLIQALQTRDGAGPDLALRYFCLMALNLNEFLFLD